MMRDRIHAEDIAARAFQVAWQKRDQFRGEASASTWLEAIARNLARASGGGRSAMQESIDRADAPELPSPEWVTDAIEKREDVALLKQALARLSDHQRRALTAHFID